MIKFTAPIRGWGEDELAAMLGVPVGRDSHEHLSEIQEELELLMHHLAFKGEYLVEAKGAACWIRRWLRELAAQEKEIGYKSSFFLGIAAVQDDWTLLSLIIQNLGILWT